MFVLDLTAVTSFSLEFSDNLLGSARGVSGIFRTYFRIAPRLIFSDIYSEVTPFSMIHILE